MVVVSITAKSATTIQANKPQEFNVPNTGMKAYVIGNLSGLTLTVAMGGTATQKTLYPSMVDWYPVKRGFTGDISISPVATLNNVATFPASSIIIDGIALDDPEEASSYPQLLVGSNNVGNQTPVGNSTGIQLDNAVSGTTIIETTVQGQGFSAIVVTNDGSITIRDTSGNIEFLLLQDDFRLPQGFLGVLAKGDLIDASLTGTILKTRGGDMVGQQSGVEIWRINNIGEYSHTLTNLPTLNGATSGTLTIYEPFKGTQFKIAILEWANFRNGGGSAQTLALHTAFANGASIITGDNPGFQLLLSGVAQSFSAITTLGGAGSGAATATTTIQTWSIGNILTGFDTVSIPALGTVAHTGRTMLIGR